MPRFIQQIQERRNSAWEQAKALLDTAEADKRDLTAEEEQTYQRLNSEIDQIDERVKTLLDAEQRTADADKAFATLLGQPVTGPDKDKSNDQLRAFLRGEARSYTIVPEGPVDYRALVKGTASAGGNLVRTSFYNRLMEFMIESSALLSAGPTVLNTDSGEPIEIPIVTSFTTGALVAEGAQIPTSEPAFGKRTLGAYKYGALMQVSTELLTDSAVDLEGFLARQAGRALGNSFGTAAITGTGSNQPGGLVTSATAGVTGGTGVAGAPTADNLIDLFYSVIAPYRNSRSAGWIMDDTTIAAVRKLKDENGQYLWAPSLQAGTPDTLLGKPVYTDTNVAAIALNAKSVIFGDISAYYIRFAGGVRFERSDDFDFDNDLVTFRALLRADGVLADQTGAVKYFAGGAS
ncbi:phage major capsid protein [Streptomyces sp. NPDC008121]|uniref:phage major capsid protein n=1 Tax=Streptomyces sp. NPDC008121 TaxID=3364809 RepID=UPI0036EE65A5